VTPRGAAAGALLMIALAACAAGFAVQRVLRVPVPEISLMPCLIGPLRPSSSSRAYDEMLGADVKRGWY